MDRETRLKLAIRYTAFAAALGVASFVSSPLFAQARALIEASATVINSATEVVVTDAVRSTLSHSQSIDKPSATPLDGGLAQLRIVRHATPRSKESQHTVITVEYAAN